MLKRRKTNETKQTNHETNQPQKFAPGKYAKCCSRCPKKCQPKDTTGAGGVSPAMSGSGGDDDAAAAGAVVEMSPPADLASDAKTSQAQPAEPTAVAP